LRPIRPDDAEALVHFHESLSPETIYYRFFAPYPELSDADVDRFTKVDYDDRMAFVATQGGQIVGIGRYDRVDDESAEVAFVIQDEHQGRGLGSVLLEHLAAAARERGFSRFVADVLPANQRMIATFTEAGYGVRQHFEDGVIGLEFNIEPNDREVAVMQAREHAYEAKSVERLLFPKKVALIGVSRRPDSVGQTVARNLLAAGFAGSLCAVHPEVDEVAGLPAYRTVAQAPGPIDLAIVTAPIDSVHEIVADCASAGVQAMEIISSGFSDLDESGPERVAELVALARESGMRVVGPEALGMINTDPRVQLNASLAPVIPGRGRIGFFCESGTLGATFLEEMAQRDLGLSTFLSPGMRVDISGNDMLQYWESDETTSVVLLYLQGLGNPRKFTRIVRRLSRRKPVLAVMSGRGAEGHRALGQGLPERVLDEVLAQVGVLQTDTIGGLLDAAALLALQPLPQGKRVALVSNSTALLLHTVDLVDRAGMHTVERPYRVRWDAGGEQVGEVLGDALAAADVDAVIVIHVPPVRTEIEEVAETLRSKAASSTKPVIAVLPYQTGLTGRSSLVVNPGESGSPGPGSVPVYGEPAAAVAALAMAVQHTEWLNTPVGDEVEAEGVDLERAEDAVRSGLINARPEPITAALDIDDPLVTTSGLAALAPDSGAVRLSDRQSAELLGSYGLELWPRFPVDSEADAVKVAAEIGYPVVLKSLLGRLRHRADLGGVRLSLENERALRTAYLSMMAQHPQEARDQLVVQAMAPPGVACTIVTREDPAFGPVLGFAVGGYVSDLVEDWAYRMLPLTDADAEELVRQPRTSALLFGYQGTEPVNIAAVEAVLMRVAQLAEDWPQLQRLELNPVVATPSGCYLLGADIQVAPAGTRYERRPRRL